ncbi:uncharacterized protein UBRO_20824 [Ustilago bromivora]|uniref:Uncharacterized protein n=1 Tax=Ustilago bromivora TaxID=307758 RepID=A0A1K0G900_9BASI|nr:uncharacterized protein UBRO_20824 [Ustilago bromivora]
MSSLFARLDSAESMPPSGLVLTQNCMPPTSRECQHALPLLPALNASPPSMTTLDVTKSASLGTKVDAPEPTSGRASVNTCVSTVVDSTRQRHAPATPHPLDHQPKRPSPTNHPHHCNPSLEVSAAHWSQPLPVTHPPLAQSRGIAAGGSGFTIPLSDSPSSLPFKATTPLSRPAPSLNSSNPLHVPPADIALTQLAPLQTLRPPARSNTTLAVPLYPPAASRLTMKPCKPLLTAGARRFSTIPTAPSLLSSWEQSHMGSTWDTQAPSATSAASTPPGTCPWTTMVSHMYDSKLRPIFGRGACVSGRAPRTRNM